jgi:hypothetical protein
VGLAGFSVTYAKGDFDYNGKVNADDYFLIDSNYNKMAVPLGVSAAAPAGAMTDTVVAPKLNFASTGKSAYESLSAADALDLL